MFACLIDSERVSYIYMIHSRHEGRGEEGALKLFSLNGGEVGRGKEPIKINLLRHKKKHNSIIT